MLTNPFASHQTRSAYRWVVLLLCAITPMFVVTLPAMSLPPLFSSIAADLNLTLVEVGMIWGVGSFIGIFFALIGGTLGDRFGSRATLFACCLGAGVFGLTRAFAQDFVALLLTTLVFGMFGAIIPVMLFKVARAWFPPHQLGMASGVISSGFATGLMLGPLLSTSVIAPTLGGWRQVLVFYGVIAIVISLLWLLVHPPTQKVEANAPRVSFMDSLRFVMRLRTVWILGIGGLGINACFAGFTGYLPTYLKSVGWQPLDADQALAAFFLASLCAVIPLSILSDRFRLRRGFLIFGAAVLATGIGSLSVIDTSLIVVTIAITGLVFDSFMAILNASVLEADGLTDVYAGTAIGFATMIRNLGGAFSPALGNSLVPLGASVPFLFWGGMALFTVLMFVFALKPHKNTIRAVEPVVPVSI